MTPYRELSRECLTAAHVLNNHDRNWQPVQHPEFYFLDSFKHCLYIVAIDVQVHVYMIGDRAKGRTYDVLNIEGNSCQHLTLSKGDIIQHIRNTIELAGEEYLPDKFMQRLIFMQPDYINGICEYTIFNKEAFSSQMFRRAEWTLGTNIYKVEQRSYKTKAADILRNMLAEVTW